VEKKLNRLRNLGESSQGCLGGKRKRKALLARAQRDMDE
jgi:hypothetical protein